MTKLLSKKTEYQVMGPIQDSMALSTPWFEHYSEAIEAIKEWPDPVPMNRCKLIKRVTIVYECVHAIPDSPGCAC
jgi:hypothetical protein